MKSLVSLFKAWMPGTVVVFQILGTRQTYKQLWTLALAQDKFGLFLVSLCCFSGFSIKLNILEFCIQLFRNTDFSTNAEQLSATLKTRCHRTNLLIHFYFDCPAEICVPFFSYLFCVLWDHQSFWCVTFEFVHRRTYWKNSFWSPDSWCNADLKLTKKNESVVRHRKKV